MPRSSSNVTPIPSEVKRFGLEVRRRRQSFSLSLADLARLTGLTSNFIGTIENGMRNPSISTMYSLGRGFGAPPAELVAEAHGLGPPGLEVARLVNLLSPLVQDRVIELLRLICIRQSEATQTPASTPPASTPSSKPARVEVPDADPAPDADRSPSNSTSNSTSK